MRSAQITNAVEPEVEVWYFAVVEPAKSGKITANSITAAPPSQNRRRARVALRRWGSAGKHRVRRVGGVQPLDADRGPMLTVTCALPWGIRPRDARRQGRPTGQRRSMRRPRRGNHGNGEGHWLLVQT